MQKHVDSPAIVKGRVARYYVNQNVERNFWEVSFGQRLFPVLVSYHLERTLYQLLCQQRTWPDSIICSLVECE